MRWYILRTLLYKEVLRHLANRGGIALVLLLIVAAMLLSFFNPTEGPTGGLVPGVQRCYVDFWRAGPFVVHLRQHVPEELRTQVVFRNARHAHTDDQGRIVYPQNTGAIQIRPTSDDPAKGGLHILFWHPGADR